MQHHLERELIKLETLFKDLCDTVEKNFSQLITAMENMDVSYFNKFPDIDYEIDDKEIMIEEECLKILALHQPVARDLRIIIAILKINAELERIGDLTSNIASRSKSLYDYKMEAGAFLIPDIYKIVKKMLHDSVESFLKRDTEKALRVCDLDSEVDRLHGKMYKILQENFVKEPDQYDAYVNYISISRFLERIADHSTNISEDIVYMLDGKIVRHRTSSNLKLKKKGNIKIK